jgi:sterol desaturase/sphingolipid hydroxylase (fatty acid hydroxylase superfamily)
MLMVETLAPRAERRLVQRAGHMLRNTALWLVGVLTVTLIFGALLGDLFRWLADHRVGLLHMVDIPAWLAAVVGFLLLDFSDYVFHRLSHRLRPLWLLHCVHHSDTDVDVSTNLRHHPLHVLCTVAWKLVSAAAIGAPLLVFMAHEIAVITVAHVHHAAIGWPPVVDRWLAWLVVTPRGHWLHHSLQRDRTDRNFGVTLSLWDRLAGTYSAPDAGAASFGLDALAANRWHSATGMLTTPFRARRIAEL